MDLRALASDYVFLLRRGEPEAVLIALFGSVARQEQGPYSDIDIRVITAGKPLQFDRVLLHRHEGRIVHLSVGARSLDGLLRQAEDPHAWSWAMGQAQQLVPLWERHQIPGVLASYRDELAARYPAYEEWAADAGYLVETILEYTAKLKNACAETSAERALLAAHHLAQTATRLVSRLRPPEPVVSERAELARVLAWDGAPRSWREDLLWCLGLSTEARPLGELRLRGLRLALAALTMAAMARDLPLPGDVKKPLLDGTFKKYLLQ